MVIRNFALNEVEITDPILKNAFEKEQEYLQSIEADRLLAGFRATAGLPKKAEQYPGGWENSELSGHTLGHYMTALAQVYASTKAEDSKERLEYILEELSACQTESGYLFATGEVIFDKLEEGKLVWMPWYTMHKLISGLLAVYRLAKLPQALRIVKKLGEWVCGRVLKWTEKEQRRVLCIADGGMSDCLYELYKEIGDEACLEAAAKFEELPLLEKTAKGEDGLSYKQANHTITKFLGAVNRYLVSGEKDRFYLDAAQLFFDIVTKNHVYVTGGMGELEHFRASGKLGENRTQCNCESCSTYNMLKLAERLYALTGEKCYMEYYESAFFNAILGSQDPETGMTTFFQPMESGYFKAFADPFSNFWCCTGTGMESFTKLNCGIYHQAEEELYVNLYIASKLRAENFGVLLTQNTSMEQVEEVSFAIEAEKPTRFVLCLRVPEWAGEEITLTLNGSVPEYAMTGGYMRLDREWKSGDRVELRFAPEVKLHSLPDKPNAVAATYGPFVLAASLGREDMTVAFMNSNVAVPTKKVPVRDRIVLKDKVSFSEWLGKGKQNFLKREGETEFLLQGTDADEQLLFRPYHTLYRERYGIYFDYYDEESLPDDLRAELEAQRSEEERLAAEAAEEERLRLEKEAEEERLAAEAAEAERLRLEKEAEEERLRREKEVEEERLRREKEAEEERLAAEAAEAERLRQEKEAEEERLRLEKEAEEERLRREKEAEEERVRLEKEAEEKRLEEERRAEEEARRLAAEKVAEAERAAEIAEAKAREEEAGLRAAQMAQEKAEAEAATLRAEAEAAAAKTEAEAAKAAKAEALAKQAKANKQANKAAKKAAKKKHHAYREFRLWKLFAWLFAGLAVLTVLYLFATPISKGFFIGKDAVDTFLAEKLPKVAEFLKVKGDGAAMPVFKNAGTTVYYVEDAEKYVAETAWPQDYRVSVERLQGKQYICIEGYGVKVSYLNEASEGESKHVYLEKGDRKALYFWEYNLENPETLCPLNGVFNNAGVEQYAFHTGTGKNGMYVLDAETLEECKVILQEETLYQALAVEEYAEEDENVRITMKVKDVPYTFTVPKKSGAAVPDAYKLKPAGIICTVGEGGGQMEAYVVSADAYLGKLTGELEYINQSYVVGELAFCAYTEATDLQGAQKTRIEVAGDNRERFLVPVREDIRKYEYDEEAFLLERNGELRYIKDGKTVSAKGIRVSEAQGRIDWETVAASGVEYAMIRIGARGDGANGRCQTDVNYKRNVKGALEEGIEAGVYFVSRATTVEEAKEEAQFVIKNMKDYEISWPVALDTVEHVGDKKTRASGISAEDRTACAKAFMEEIAAAGYTPVWYADSRWSVLKYNMGELADYDMWYTSSSEDDAYPYHYTMWQYKNDTEIPGISKNAELSMSFVDYGQAKKQEQ